MAARPADKLPPHLSDLLRRLRESARFFIERHECHKDRMQEIANALRKLSEKIKRVQRSANTNRLIGAASGGLGIAVGVAAGIATAFFGGERVGLMVLGGCAAAVGGAGFVVKANLQKAEEEKTTVETVEKLGEEFLAFVEQLKNGLEGIKEVSEEFREKSSLLMTTTDKQTEIILSETKQLQQLLRQTAGLADRCREVMDVTLNMERGVGEMLSVITRITPIPEEDSELRKSVSDSAQKCEKTLDEFAKLRDILKDFEEITE